MNMYARFGVMVTTSTAVMYGLMYLNTYEPDHVFFSETRADMALIMGAGMSIVMLAFMLKMHSNQRLNAGIFAGRGVIVLIALWLVRSQAAIEDVSYMKAMIPHHSVAILTSERRSQTLVSGTRGSDYSVPAQRDNRNEGLIKDLEGQR